MTPLHLPEKIAQQIEAEGVAAFPKECCGMLIGREKREDGRAYRVVERIERADNSFDQEEQYHRFSIPPLQQMKAERAAEKEGMSLLGFYHSHPDHPSRPSEYDREHAWETFSYVIVSILSGEPDRMTSWMLEGAERQFSEQPIVRDEISSGTGAKR